MTATKALTPIDWLIDPPPARVDPAVEAATKSNSIESATAISRAAAPPADTATPMIAPVNQDNDRERGDQPQIDAGIIPFTGDIMDVSVAVARVTFARVAV